MDRYEKMKSNGYKLLKFCSGCIGWLDEENNEILFEAEYDGGKKEIYIRVKYESVEDMCYSRMLGL